MKSISFFYRLTNSCGNVCSPVTFLLQEGAVTTSTKQPPAMYCIDNRASLVLLLGAFNYLLLGATATTYNVYPSGGELTINEAMSLAEAGDTVSLADGTYDEAIVSKRDGTESSPITVKGGRSAVINGGYSSRNVLITHSYITLEAGDLLAL